MRAHQIMTRGVVTIGPDTPIVEAAHLMLKHHISGLPVVSPEGQLVGIVSEGDFLRRAEVGTQRKRNRWLKFLIGPGKEADAFVHERGRKVGEIMTMSPYSIVESTPLAEIVELMETRHVKRLPVLGDGRVVGIVTRANLVRAVASLAREVPDPTADDAHIEQRVAATIEANDWRPLGFSVSARRGVVHLHGVITDDRTRRACLVAAENVAGVKEVHDHLCWVDPMSGMYVNSAEDEALARAG
ncbi:CBS domain-containing protein [Bradyrhizobium sp. U87765 SZCCT0131]|uniref:CBS domain-containing protein n=1 Tax=unclassified Bradyrhizobium TaxID=2631580 RepID=UPI001BAB30A4|nr:MULTISPECIES: CBS domain-containing protein [unclassified Bradyrhizobium]MBR1217786.1 CBS domain-containing protein [Bradyrhizobium sp. U87765 SZCCT0131]MBR1261268.1 CBS domain-containing protein [Bradyrhizobium sp. U87765 SZCCT0134]MBR1303284.1 CBS domain-containing protein [Bradyrhizobium sp. U87765 SZCCT0110]MBR1318890.1 CBS domain-containing protein [Bradyrhizobium sp. U87765 SZCCT0109]MBR1347215.1 CBS domain-containing protein [Bradyrhizobium sp. U87765 SZCCT0048]